MYFPALLAARFLGQPRAFTLSLTAILNLGSRLPSSAQTTSSTRVWNIHTKTMAAGSRSLWSMSIYRSNFTPCLHRCRTNRLRLKSSVASVTTARKKLFQRRGFWLFFGTGTSVLGFTGYYNRLWEAKQRRKLRVSVEGIGRFFRWVKITQQTNLRPNIRSDPLRISRSKLRAKIPPNPCHTCRIYDQNG